MSTRYTYDVTRDAASVLALRPEWEKLALDFNSDTDFCLAVVEE